jgi:MFS family permease
LTYYRVVLVLLGQRNYRLLWLAGLASWIGNWVLFAALPFHVLSLTGSALATGGMLIAQALPSLLLGSIAGVFVDRWDRKRVMVAADLLRGVFLLPLLLVQTADLVWLVYLVGFLQECVSRFADPAFGAALPRVVGRERIVEANAAQALAMNGARLVGPPLGGALLALHGLGSVVAIDSLSFVVSALLVLFVRIPAGEPVDAEAERPNVWRDWLAGLRLVAGEGWLAALFVVVAIQVTAEGVLSLAFLVFARDMLGGGSQELGWLLSAQAVGSLAAAPVVGRIGKWLAPGSMIAFGALGLGSYWLAVLLLPRLPLAIGLMVVCGIPALTFGIGVNALIQGGVPDAYRGRVFGALFTTMALLSLVGRGFATLFGDALGAPVLVGVVAGFDLLAGLAAVALLRRRAAPVEPALVRAG